MGYYASRQLAAKRELAEELKNLLGDPKDLQNEYYGFSREEKDGNLLVTWDYEKYPSFDSLEKFLTGKNRESYLYCEQNEYDEKTSMGLWLDNPFGLNVVKEIEFGSGKTPLDEVYEIISKLQGEDEARSQLEALSEKIGNNPRP